MTSRMIDADALDFQLIGEKEAALAASRPRLR